MSQPALSPAWHARLKLGMTVTAGRTVLKDRIHHGPLRVQKPFYPGDGAAHLYLLHPPGGLVGGDQLEIELHSESRTHTLVTTPAANKFYRSDGRLATISQQLNIGDQACIEWLPQETILYSGCEARMRTRITLAAQSRFIGWEIVCLGRPAANEQFDNGSCEQRLELWRDGQPLLIERNRFDGADDILHARWGYAGFTVTATMLATPVTEAYLARVREQIKPDADALIGLTLMDDVLVVRSLGRQARSALSNFQTIWQVLRPLLLNVPACAPRIWTT